jgi:hypothetical protein
LTPPPAQPAPGFARPHVDCTTSYLLPILDSAVTAYQLAGVVYVSTLDDARFRNYPISRQADMALGAAFAAAFASSAVYGYVSAARCRRIQRGPPAQDYLPGVSSRLGPTRELGGGGAFFPTSIAPVAASAAAP